MEAGVIVQGDVAGEQGSDDEGERRLVQGPAADASGTQTGSKTLEKEAWLIFVLSFFHACDESTMLSRDTADASEKVEKPLCEPYRNEHFSGENHYGKPLSTGDTASGRALSRPHSAGGFANCISLS